MNPLANRSRLAEVHLPLTLLFGGTAVLSAATFLVLSRAGAELELSLGIIGLLLGVLLPLGVEIRNHSGRVRTVLVLDYRDHQYGHAIARGVQRTLYADRRQWKVTYQRPDEGSDIGSTDWQVQRIQEAIIEDVDGLVLVPGGDDERLWTSLAALIKHGAFVVAVDTKPTNRIFRDLRVPSPRFVSSNYSTGGVLLGQHLSEWLDADARRRAVLYVGPEGSWPGEERSRNILYELARNGLLDRTSLLPLTGWAPDAARCRQLLDLVDRSFDGDVAVYVGDDENAMALHVLTLTERPDLRRRISIIGANGTPDDWGRVPVIEMGAVSATIDIRAEDQGEEAAHLMIRERYRKLDASVRSVYLAPQLLARRPEEDWLAKAFPGVIGRVTPPSVLSPIDGPAETPEEAEAATRADVLPVDVVDG